MKNIFGIINLGKSFKYDLKKSLFEMLKFYQFNKINIDYINFNNEKKLLKILKKK